MGPRTRSISTSGRSPGGPVMTDTNASSAPSAPGIPASALSEGIYCGGGSMTKPHPVV
jgi:hypothetical protein